MRVAKVKSTRKDSELQTFGDIIFTLCGRLLYRLIAWLIPCLFCLFLAIDSVSLCALEPRTKASAMFCFYVSLLVLGILFDISNMIWMKGTRGKIKPQEMNDFLLLNATTVAAMYTLMLLGMILSMFCLIESFILRIL